MYKTRIENFPAEDIMTIEGYADVLNEILARGNKRLDQQIKSGGNA